LTTLDGKRIVHVTTVDMSLVLLLGRQLRAFADAGMEVIGVSAPGPYVAQLESWGIRHVPLQHATRSPAPGQDVLALIELRRLFRRLRPDIVHTHNPKPGLYGRLAARTTGVPGVVNTVHGLYASPEDHVVTRSVVYALERLASLCSGAELVQNAEDLAVLERLGVSEKKLVLLGNGVDLERFRPEVTALQRQRARKALGVPEKAVVVGTVARLVWQKGFRELFAAAELLRDRCPDVLFVVVGGSDPDKSDAIGSQEQEDASRRGRVVFAGSREKMEDVYQAFDMFVLPSHREGFPRSAMEAAASGLPVIATDIRGCRQAVSDGDSGLLVPLGDPPRLAAAIEELAADAELRSRMGAAGRRKAEAEFDDRTVVAKTLRAYERVLNPDRSSSTRRTPSSAARSS
jgi:glycosyltransferase involved in cell wall biosynthesis